MPLHLPPLLPVGPSSAVRALLSRRAERAGRVGRARRLLARHGEAEAVAVLEAEEKRRESRRLSRERRGASGWRRGTPQCGGCRRILSGYGQRCPNCGFTDGVGYPR
jgi:hypothetical protein